MQTNETLLIAVVTPAVEETLVDWLLERDDITGFSSNPVDGHGTRQSELSLAEQVTGRQRKVMFHIHGPRDAMEAVTAGLKTDFRGAGVHYWLMPLFDAGSI